MAQVESLATVGAGVFAYLAFFHRGEHFLYGVRYLQLFLLTVIAATIAYSNQNRSPIKQSLGVISQYAGLFLAGLYSSCIIYRLFFNPLNSFPGPYWARLSKFDHCFRNGKFDGHHVLEKLHKKYGKFVRIGPNDLSVIDADGTQVVSAANSKCYKAPWYANDTPFISLHTTRDRVVHDKRRRIWSPAFSDKALRGYEVRVQDYINLFIKKIEEYKGKPVNATNLLNFFSFDVMGDLAFGKSFDMLSQGEVHWAIKLLGEGMDPLALQLPPWFFRVLVAIPGLSKGYHQFIDFCTKRLEQRIDVHGKTDPDKADITQVLIDHYQKSDNQKTLWPMMCGDSRLIIVAGSDTTAATLTHLFYHLAKEKKWQTDLRDEIDRLKQTNGAIEDQAIKDAPILNGLINETLRLHPPVPSGVFRKTPREGVKIGETFVPGDTHIQMPQYVMSRSEDNYAKPLEFIPDRWDTAPELIKHKDAFAPFSTGPFGCIGKNLAYMEVRSLTAQVVDKFDVEFAPGEDGSKLLKETTDHFTLGLAPLELIFKPRA